MFVGTSLISKTNQSTKISKWITNLFGGAPCMNKISTQTNINEANINLNDLEYVFNLTSFFMATNTKNKTIFICFGQKQYNIQRLAFVVLSQKLMRI